jgi:hypothetical protein
VQPHLVEFFHRYFKASPKLHGVDTTVGVPTADKALAARTCLQLDKDVILTKIAVPQKGSPILLLGVLHAVLRHTILKEAESFLLRTYGELTYQALKKRAKLISCCGMRKLEILRYALPLVIFTTMLHAHIITKTGLGPARQGVSWFCTATIHILS